MILLICDFNKRLGMTMSAFSMVSQDYLFVAKMFARNALKHFVSSLSAVPSFGNNVTLVTVILFMPTFGKLYNSLVSFVCNGKIFKQQFHRQSGPIKILQMLQGFFLFILCLLDHTRREVETSYVIQHKCKLRATRELAELPETVKHSPKCLSPGTIPFQLRHFSGLCFQGLANSEMLAHTHCCTKVCLGQGKFAHRPLQKGP